MLLDAWLCCNTCVLPRVSEEHKEEFRLGLAVPSLQRLCRLSAPHCGPGTAAASSTVCRLCAIAPAAH